MSEIQPFDVHAASEEVLRSLHRLAVAVEREDFPEDEPNPYEFVLARWRQPSTPHEIAKRYYVMEDGEVAGYLITVRWPQDDPLNSYVAVRVHPDRRGHGLGRTLLSFAMDSLSEDGVEKLIMDVADGRPWESALERWGLRKSLGDKQSRLYLSDVDWDLMDRWIERAGERASEYEVLHFEGAIPDEYLEAWCAVKHSMNTAPLEDLELADFDMTPEKWRLEEQAIALRGDVYMAAGALHKSTGVFGGFTDIFFNPLHPVQAEQHDTGVDPEHRNLGLGRWVKAEMIKRLAHEHPSVQRIDTWNAGSNAAMLGINVEMGFKPVLLSNAWQGEIADIRSRMDGELVDS